MGLLSIKSAGKDLGGEIKGFKEAVKDQETEHARKNRMLSHENSTPFTSNNLNMQVGNQINDMKISSVTIDFQQTA